MNKYFELRTNQETLFGVINNIPVDTDMKTISDRIEVTEPGEELLIVDKIFDDKYLDIILDWVEIDYVHELDPELILMTEILDEAYKLNIENLVVFSALSSIKKTPDLSITDAMKNSIDNLK